MQRLMASQGFVHTHTNGDHEIWEKKGALRPCVLPTSKDPVAEFIVKNNMRVMGLSRKEVEGIMRNLK